VRGRDWGLHEGLTWLAPGFPQTDEHPAACIAWADAVAFCAWLSRKAGEQVSLPSEAQWEYACRAGSEALWPWGDRERDAQGKANVLDEGQELGWTHGFKEVRDGYTFTAPVGSFQPNAFGLCDMIGNVWEWAADRYDGKYYDRSPRDDPEGPAEGEGRSFRGGCWSHGPYFSRPAHRGIPDPRYTGADVGFRVACKLR
jgi:formylglycine-generating enzyme required for sulfatase activity